MLQAISRFLDRFSEFYAHRKGLLPLVGIVLILLNFFLQHFLPAGYRRATCSCTWA
jgi:hypothetical protein